MIINLPTGTHATELSQRFARLGDPSMPMTCGQCAHYQATTACGWAHLSPAALRVAGDGAARACIEFEVAP